MNKYHIRFNTKHNGSELVWRIFETVSSILQRMFDLSEKHLQNVQQSTAKLNGILPATVE